MSGNHISTVQHQGGVDLLDFSPDSTTFISGSKYGNTAMIWDAETGQIDAVLPHEGWVRSVAFDSTGKWAASGGDDGLMRIWDLDGQADQLVESKTHNEGNTKIAVSPNRNLVASGSWSEGDVLVWDIDTGSTIYNIHHESFLAGISFSSDGSMVSMNDKTGWLQVWNVLTGQSVFRNKYEESISSSVFSPDGNFIASAGCNKKNILVSYYQCAEGVASVWNLLALQEVFQVSYTGDVTSVSFSPNGQLLASGGCNGYNSENRCQTGLVIVTEIDSKENKQQILLGDVVSDVAFSPDGSLLAASSKSGEVWVLDVFNGEKILTGKWLNSVDVVDFSPDGKKVIIGGCNRLNRANICVGGEVSILELSTGREVTSMTHDGNVNDLSVNPENDLLVTGSRDRTIRVWNIQSGKELSRINLDEAVNSVAFSVDSNWIVSGSSDGKAQVWWWKPDDLIELGCNHVSRNLTRTEWQQYFPDEDYRITCPQWTASE